MIVLDASAAVAILLNLGASAQRLRERLTEEDLHVPHLFEVEVLHALRRHVLGGVSTYREAELLQDLTSMSLTRYPHTALLERIWDLRNNLTAYDAAYVALAESLAAPLVTLDARLAQASGIRVPVEVYG